MNLDLTSLLTDSLTPKSQTTTALGNILPLQLDLSHGLQAWQGSLDHSYNLLISYCEGDTKLHRPYRGGVAFTLWQ